MKKHLKLIFPAAGAVAWFALLCALAVSAKAAANDASVSAATNAKPVDAMTALFGDPVIVKAKGFEIKRSELDQVVTGLKSAAAAQGQTISPAQLTQIEGQLLGRLIQVQLLLPKATDADKAGGAQKADLLVSNLQARAGSPEVLNRQLKAVGMTMAELRARVAQESTAQAALTRELHVDVADAEVKKFYDEHPADFEQPEMAHVRHILLMTMDPVTRTPLTADQQKAKQKQAADLLTRIRGGADFAALAKQYSEDPGSKDNGGDLPAFPRGQMRLPEFEAAAFSLTNNQVSDVVTSSFGYHIIQLLDKTPAKKLVLADKVPTGDATIASKVKELLVQQKVEKLRPAYVDKIKQSVDVQILDPDLKAAVAAAEAAAAAAPAATPEP